MYLYSTSATMGVQELHVRCKSAWSWVVAKRSLQAWCFVALLDAAVSA